MRKNTFLSWKPWTTEGSRSIKESLPFPTPKFSEKFQPSTEQSHKITFMAELYSLTQHEAQKYPLPFKTSLGTGFHMIQGLCWSGFTTGLAAMKLKTWYLNCHCCDSPTNSIMGCTVIKSFSPLFIQENSSALKVTLKCIQVPATRGKKFLRILWEIAKGKKKITFLCRPFIL